MGTIVQWAETAVSWVLLFFAELYGQVFGISSGVTWALAYMSLAFAVAAILAYPTRRQLEMQRLVWQCTPLKLEVAKKLKNDRVARKAARKEIDDFTGYNPWLQILPILVSFCVFLALNAVIDGISQNEPAGVFAWSQNADLMADAHDASIFGVPFYGTFLEASATPNPTATRVLIVVLLVAMMYINWQWQRQLNGKLSDSKLIRRQQQFPLFIGPIALLVLVLVFDAALGTMIFLMASDLFNYVIQAIWLSRRPIDPVDPAFITRLRESLPNPR
mgnify:FL=1